MARCIYKPNPDRDEYFDYITVDSRAAIKVIQSLPDQWVDAEKVREIYDRYRASEIALHEAFRAAVALTTPSLPTLADMTPEEREACQWMQAELRINTTRSPMDCVIAAPGRSGGHVRVWHEDGGSMDVPANEVTPRTDLPRLEWPGSHADTITAESVEDVQAGRVADFEPALPRPEDVPAGDPWLVKCGSHEWVGTRESRVEIVCSWALARLDGADYTVARDDEITLVSRLVPEVTP